MYLSRAGIVDRLVRQSLDEPLDERDLGAPGSCNDKSLFTKFYNLSFCVAAYYVGAIINNIL